MEMKKTIIIIIVVVCVFLFMSAMIFYGISSTKETREACESEGGEYEGGQNRCYFKKNGVYEQYKFIEINGRKRLVRE